MAADATRTFSERATDVQRWLAQFEASDIYFSVMGKHEVWHAPPSPKLAAVTATGS